MQIGLDANPNIGYLINEVSTQTCQKWVGSIQPAATLIMTVGVFGRLSNKTQNWNSKKRHWYRKNAENNKKERMKLKSTFNILKWKKCIHFLEFLSNFIFQNNTQKKTDLGSKNKIRW